MAPADLKRIFERFFQPTSCTLQNGLGMSLVQEIMRATTVMWRCRRCHLGRGCGSRARSRPLRAKTDEGTILPPGHDQTTDWPGRPGGRRPAHAISSPLSLSLRVRGVVAMPSAFGGLDPAAVRELQGLLEQGIFRASDQLVPQGPAHRPEAGPAARPAGALSPVQGLGLRGRTPSRPDWLPGRASCLLSVCLRQLACPAGGDP